MHTTSLAALLAHALLGSRSLLVTVLLDGLGGVALLPGHLVVLVGLLASGLSSGSGLAARVSVTSGALGGVMHGRVRTVVVAISMRVMSGIGSVGGSVVLALGLNTTGLGGSATLSGALLRGALLGGSALARVLALGSQSLLVVHGLLGLLLGLGLLGASSGGLLAPGGLLGSGGGLASLLLLVTCLLSTLLGSGTTLGDSTSLALASGFLLGLLVSSGLARLLG